MAKQLLDNRTIQEFLKAQGFYTSPVDGVVGPGTLAAMGSLLAKVEIPAASWNADRRRTAVEQFILSALGFRTGGYDGIIGPQTLDALERYQNHIRDVEPRLETVSHLPTRWPREGDVRSFYGDVGENQVTLEFPYEMRLAWDPNTVVRRTQCHAKVHDSLASIFSSTLAHYGANEIRRLRLDQFGGCLNVRQKKGGRSYSMHSWGIAVDLDPGNNQLRWGKDRASLARPEYDVFWGIVEGEGWVSLGREKNYDWMHFQAARF